MKLSLACLFVLVASFLVSPQTSLAQSTAANTRPTSEQSLQELVKEVRQLRAELRRINAAVYRGQVLIERLKLQQEQVSRISRELNDVRENISEVKGRVINLRDLVTRTETGVEAGQKHPGELAGLKSELDNLGQREHRLSAREVQLANDLELERAKLNHLNDRLNAFELELTAGRP